MVPVAPAPAAIADAEAPTPPPGLAAGDVAMEAKPLPEAMAQDSNEVAAASSRGAAASPADYRSAHASRLAAKRRPDKTEAPPPKAVQMDEDFTYVMEVAANEKKFNPRVSRAGAW